MRILVLNDEGEGAVSVRERREMFDVDQFRLSYTCPDCKNELIFSPERSATLPTEDSCPICHNKVLKSVEVKWCGKDVSVVALWEAVRLYREFYDHVSKHKVPLKLAVIQPQSSGSS